jgi:enoyl-CoA hydratase/carnithine racemase
MEERLSAAGGEILADVRNGVATVTLNRPAALNALTLGMLQGFAQWMEAWAHDDRVRVIVLRGAGDKAFCAGGDVRAIREAWQAGRPDVLDFFIVEYKLDHRIYTYPKPVVAVMDGIVMGGGMGLAQGCSLRIATGKTRMAMPETTIGLFPDVGGSYFLPRSPGQIGAYLGLVGGSIRAADALYANLADAYLADDALAKLDAELAAAAATTDPRTALKDMAKRLASEPPGKSELKELRGAIDFHFGQPDMGLVVSSLKTMTHHTLRGWSEQTIEAIGKRSPTALAVTHEQLRRGKNIKLGDAFRMELGMVAAALEHGDFMEGVRALLVDKDNAPQWKARRNSEVKDEDIEKFFAPRWSASEHPLKDLP